MVQNPIPWPGIPISVPINLGARAAAAFRKGLARTGAPQRSLPEIGMLGMLMGC